MVYHVASFIASSMLCNFSNKRGAHDYTIQCNKITTESFQSQLLLLPSGAAVSPGQLLPWQIALLPLYYCCLLPLCCCFQLLPLYCSCCFQLFLQFPSSMKLWMVLKYNSTIIIVAPSMKLWVVKQHHSCSSTPPATLCRQLLFADRSPYFPLKITRLQLFRSFFLASIFTFQLPQYLTTCQLLGSNSILDFVSPAARPTLPASLSSLPGRSPPCS